MDAGALLPRDGDQALGAGQGGQRVAPHRMRGGIARNALAHAFDEPIFVLAVEGGAAAGLAQDFRHARVVGHQQRAGGRAHEDFYAGRARQALQFRDVFGVFMRAADPEGEIAMHSPGSPRNLVGQSLRRGGQRIGVGHFEHAGHAAEHSCARTAFEIFLVGRAGLAKMHLGVDHAGQDMQSDAIDHGSGAGLRQVADGGDGLADDADVARTRAVVIDQHAAPQDEIEICARHGVPQCLTRLRTDACMDEQESLHS